MSRNKIIILVVVLILIAALVFYFFFLRKEKTEFEGENFTTGENTVVQILSFTGKISGIDLENSFLMVKTDKEEIKVIVSETTKLLELNWPASFSKDLPAGTKVVPERKEISLSDFTEGKEVLVISEEDITGKSEINNVSLVQILP